MDLAINQTHGMVCAHHHLYSSLARGMPGPVDPPLSFLNILESVWWKLDQALDLDTIFWSAKLGALEALETGTTCIIDHHESPNAIEGSLSVIADACAEVGVRVNTCYGVTDRHPSSNYPPISMTEGARKGLEENRRFLSEGGRGMVGLHAAFTCSDETIENAASLAEEFNVGVHTHVAEGEIDVAASDRLHSFSHDNWILAHGVFLEDDHDIQGTIIHNPRSNMNNSVGYAAPKRFRNPVGLGTDGIGADMFDEFRIGYVRLREEDITESPETVWEMLEVNARLFPESQQDVVTWSYPEIDPWHLAFSLGVKPRDIVIAGEEVMKDGIVMTVDADEVRSKAREAAMRLFKKIDNLP